MFSVSIYHLENAPERFGMKICLLRLLLSFYYDGWTSATQFFPMAVGAGWAGAEGTASGKQPFPQGGLCGPRVGRSHSMVRDGVLPDAKVPS